jgi:hypothetical protein
MPPMALTLASASTVRDIVVSFRRGACADTFDDGDWRTTDRCCCRNHFSNDPFSGEERQ